MERRDFLKYSATTVAGSVLLNNTANAILSNTATDKPADAYYIWYEGDNGLGRNQFGNFRKSFTITSIPQNAEINIFADTSYQLFINRQFVQFGPLRFDPKFPVYDVHNIASYLKVGENVIAIQVNHYGCKTYKSIPTRAGLIAWGTVKTSKETISLVTNKKNWQAKKSQAHERYAYKMSFALNPVDFYEQAKEDKGWKNIGFSKEATWAKAQEIAEQNNWGIATARTLPYMSGESVAIAEVLHLLPLVNAEDWHSFEVHNPDHFKDGADQRKHILFKTYMHSEADTQISVGTFYGELWLNGEEQTRGFESSTSSMRINQNWKLNKGWNELYGSVGLYFDVLHHYFAVPINRGIVFNADKQLDGTVKFYRSQLLSHSDFQKIIADEHIALPATDGLVNFGGWLKILSTDKAQSSCRETSWDTYGQQTQHIAPKEINNLLVKSMLYPQGFSLTLDLGQTKLILPMISFTGVNGATIDITYSEQFTSDNQHLLHSFNYAAGDRIICSENEIDWFPSTARGARYVKITVRNTNADIVFKSLIFRSANYPVKHIGEFHCSDSLLNSIWQLGKNTELSNMEDAYIDCPTRERAMYIRDTIIQYHVNLAAFGDQQLMRRCLELYGQSPDATGKFRAVYPNTGDYTISDFSLNMVEGFKSYLDQSGDKKLIQKYWPEIMKNIAWFNQLADERADGLLDSEWHIKRKINANYGGFHGDLGIADGTLSTVGIHCVFSTTYLIALQDAEKMATAIGKVEDAAKLAKRAAALAKSINDNFWDDNQKCYADNFEKTTYSIHASLFAVRAEIVDESKLLHIRKHVNAKLPGLFVNGYDAEGGVYVSPSFAFYIFDGLYKAGLEKLAEKIMHQAWGWMLYKGMKTCPEYFDFRNSLCHAWSASPTYYLSKYVLGVSYPVSTNTDIVQIKVQADNVTSAEGKYPHPKGAISIKWHTENGKRIFDYVKAPDGVVVNVLG